MCTDRIAGNNWRDARLMFDDVAEAVQDVNVEIRAPDVNGVFEGRFKDLAGTVLPDDQLVDGRCVVDGLRPRIVFTRRHADRNITTRYSGRVVLVGGSTTVMIRGRFTRATKNSDGSVTIAGGDHETEKPT